MAYLNGNKILLVNAEIVEGDTDEAYEAGKLAILDESKYMHPTISGSIIIANDVTPIEHNLDIKLSSDTITDFSTVNVTRCGKNIFDADTVLPSLENSTFPNNHWEKQEDGSFYIANSGVLIKLPWFENTKGYKGQMAISISVKIPEGNENDNSFTMCFRYTDGTSNVVRFYGGNDDFVIGTLVSNPTKTVSYIDQSSNRARPVYIKDIMIAYGDNTDYEPYNPQTTIANSDGTVEGLLSLSPNMTLYTDTDDVNIDCQYYRDIDLYIDNLIGNVVLSGGD